MSAPTVPEWEFDDVAHADELRLEATFRRAPTCNPTFTFASRLDPYFCCTPSPKLSKFHPTPAQGSSITSACLGLILIVSAGIQVLYADICESGTNDCLVSPQRSGYAFTHEPTATPDSDRPLLSHDDVQRHPSPLSVEALGYEVPPDHTLDRIQGWMERILTGLDWMAI